MSLLQALAEAVVNVSAAKTGGRVGQGGSDSLFGQKPAETGGSLEDMLGSLLGGGASQGQTSSGGQAQGGLGGLLEALTQQGSGTGGSGGLDDILGQLTSNLDGQGGGLGNILGALSGALSQSGGGSQEGSFGDLLNRAIATRGQKTEMPKPSAPQEAAAGLMLKAMIQAAKSDGKFDQAEQAKLLDKLGDVSAAEQKFVNDELAKPIDVEGLARSVPRGLENQVYAMSVLAIDLDNQNEAQYLHSLAQSLNIDQRTSNMIHSKVGAPVLYR